MKRNILFVTDQSDDTDGGLSYAFDLARMMDKGISVLLLRKEHLMSRFETLMTVLAERRKFIRGKDGFYLSAQWLDEVIAKVRDHPGPELSVADFKALTGLSRKFSIPLLELLDEMGVTRRVGGSRVVVGEGRKA